MLRPVDPDDDPLRHESKPNTGFTPPLVVSGLHDPGSPYVPRHPRGGSPNKEVEMYIGGGLLTLIIVILLLVWLF